MIIHFEYYTIVPNLAAFVPILIKDDYTTAYIIWLHGVTVYYMIRARDLRFALFFLFYVAVKFRFLYVNSSWSFRCASKATFENT